MLYQLESGISSVTVGPVLPQEFLSNKSTSNFISSCNDQETGCWESTCLTIYETLLHCCDKDCMCVAQWEQNTHTVLASVTENRTEYSYV